ncbi:Putative glycine N-acyltransferase-like protein 1B [Frankliniella fusca]|uniref:Glycine N-acyltransferase-like protein 1B n=1 Tax=Frankliniella fusca TaxID=407009 RepID=A0AAE1LDS9_9NEOP|nr:Putative glycine N-acyltransferase-like protein 1B [Frankliniella fusca]
MAGTPGTADPLRELVADAEIESLLKALGRDLPHSVHVYNRVATQQRWRRQGEAADVAIYRAVEEGDATDGNATVVSVWRVGTVEEVSVALHSTDPGGGALRAALARSVHIPWAERINFESVHERCLLDLLAAVQARGDDLPRLVRTHKMYLSKEAALELDVRSVPGLRMGELQPHHAAAVNDSWAYKSTGTEDMFASAIRRNPGLSLGLFREEDPAGEPVAFVLGAWYGGLGILYTHDAYRRRGLGELVTRAASRTLAARHGLHVHCNIVYPNPASEATLAKVGFRRVCECTWVHYTPPPRPRSA